MNLKEQISSAEFRGKQQAKLEDLKNLMASLRISPDQAMDILHIPESDRAFYKARLEEATVQEQSGEFNSRMDSVPKIMDAFHISLDQALALLQLSKSERDFYQKHLPE